MEKESIASGRWTFSFDDGFCGDGYVVQQSENQLVAPCFGFALAQYPCAVDDGVVRPAGIYFHHPYYFTDNQIIR